VTADRWQMLQGEALAELAKMPTASVDLLCTDPPYSSGGAFRGDRMASARDKYEQNHVVNKRADFTGDNRDQLSYAYWTALWLSEALRVAKPGAPAILFTDWRQLPTTTNAMQAGGFIWRGIVAWDKTAGCRPQMGRFASQCEFAVWGSAGPMPDERGVGCLPGFFATPEQLDIDDDLDGVLPPSVSVFPDPRHKHHIAGKPVALMVELLKICEPGGLVLDPFAGSGSTGVAALRTGRRFVGVEMLDEHIRKARKRLAAEAAGVSLEAHEAGQIALPGLGATP
jgi:site-specific DNA-methyltransferase (adenine-specific)